MVILAPIKRSKRRKTGVSVFHLNENVNYQHIPQEHLVNVHLLQKLISASYLPSKPDKAVSPEWSIAK